MTDRIAQIRAVVKKKRLRHRAIHVSLSETEHAEFIAACEAHGMLEREMVMNSMRAYKSLVQRVDLLAARLTILEAAVRSPEEKP